MVSRAVPVILSRVVVGENLVDGLCRAIVPVVAVEPPASDHPLDAAVGHLDVSGLREPALQAEVRFDQSDYLQVLACHRCTAAQPMGSLTIVGVGCRGRPRTIARFGGTRR